MSNTTQQTDHAIARRGASIVEVFGCMAALGAGIVLGSLYLGIDVGAVAVKTLQGESPAIVVEGDELAASRDPQPDGQEGDDLDAAGESAEDLAGGESLEEPTADQESNELVDFTATRDYWTELTAALDHEADNRTQKPSAQQGWQLFDYIVSRRDGHAETVDQLQQLAAGNVDRRLLDFAHRVEDWHQRGADLYDRAANLLTDSSSSDLGGPVAQSWQSAATQHRMEERLLLERRQTLDRYVRRHADPAQ